MSTLYKEGVKELEDPKYFCPKCGEKLYSHYMMLAERDINRTIGGDQPIKQGFYTCLNYKRGESKCELYLEKLPEWLLERLKKMGSKTKKLESKIKKLEKLIEKAFLKEE